MKTINSEKALLFFLNEIAKRSVRDASKKLFEQDSYVDNFTEKLEKEMDELQEQEEEEAPPIEGEEEEAPPIEGEEEGDEAAAEEEPAEEEPAEEPEAEPAAEEEPVEEPAEEEPAEPKKPKKNPAAEKALSLPDYEMNQDVSFDQILTAINLVRAGNSTKSKKTKGEIETYFNRLDDEEKSVLAIYLKELAKIMTGAIDAEDAQDPSDPSTYFDIIIKSGAGDARKKSQEQPDAEKQEPTPLSQEPEKQTSGEEDITPPIRVNEQQSFRGLRKIRG